MPILVDKAQRNLDAASRRYYRAYNRGYLLSQRGDEEKGQRILDRANRDYEAAKLRFRRERELEGLLSA